MTSKQRQFVKKSIQEIEWELTSIKGNAIGIFGAEDGVKVADKILENLLQRLQGKSS